MASQTPGDLSDPGATQEFVVQPDSGYAVPTAHRPSPAPPTAPGKRTTSPSAQGTVKAPAVVKLSVLGDYRLTAKLGEGAMGAVYRARQVSRPRDVALKVLTKAVAARPGFLERFHREGRLLARLDHPHVVRCLAIGESHGFHYLALEYVAGGSVGAWLQRLGRFPVPDAVHVVLACAAALAHAHGLGLVHRDIKPDNMLLTPDGVVKLADLGLAKAADDDEGLTRTGIGIGTPLYAAPEQTRDARHADARSDLYALGCVLYHLMAGRPPFEGANFLELIKAKERGTFTPVARRVLGAPPILDRILTRLLARLPEQRYAGCDELIDDLAWQGLAGPRLSFLEAGEGGTGETRPL